MPRIRNANRRRIANNNPGHTPSMVPNNVVPDEANVQEMRNNALYSHLMQQFQVNVLDVFKKHVEKETRKRKAAEAKLEQKDRMFFRVVERCNFYYNCNVDLQDLIGSMRGRSGHNNNNANGNGNEEEVVSNFKPDVMPCDIFCRHCRRALANVVWQPCRHLSACAGCDAMLWFCPICGCAKMDSFRVNVSKSEVF